MGHEILSVLIQKTIQTNSFVFLEILTLKKPDAMKMCIEKVIKQWIFLAALILKTKKKQKKNIILKMTLSFCKRVVYFLCILLNIS